MWAGKFTFDGSVLQRGSEGRNVYRGREFPVLGFVDVRLIRRDFLAAALLVSGPIVFLAGPGWQYR